MVLENVQPYLFHIKGFEKKLKAFLTPKKQRFNLPIFRLGVKFFSRRSPKKLRYKSFIINESQDFSGTRNFFLIISYAFEKSSFETDGQGGADSPGDRPQ